MSDAVAWAALARGFGLGLGLIIAIGAQNAFVLRQGLLRRHLLAVALTCTLCDAGLIAVGVAGFGTLVSHSPTLTRIASWAGAVFLLAYGARAFLSAARAGTLDAGTGEAGHSLRGTFLMALAFSLLNPHVYLDTVVLVGSLAAQYPWPTRGVFGLGAMLASFVWFFSLAFGAGRLTPLFSRPKTWQVLDVFIGIVMWSIAWKLTLSTVRG